MITLSYISLSVKNLYLRTARKYLAEIKKKHKVGLIPLDKGLRRSDGNPSYTMYTPGSDRTNLDASGNDTLW